jgi:hypothetical protein
VPRCNAPRNRLDPYLHYTHSSETFRQAVRPDAMFRGRVTGPLGGVLVLSYKKKIDQVACTLQQDDVQRAALNIRPAVIEEEKKCKGEAVDLAHRRAYQQKAMEITAEKQRASCSRWKKKRLQTRPGERLASLSRTPNPTHTPSLSLSQIIADCFSIPLRPWPKEPNSCDGGILDMPFPRS